MYYTTQAHYQNNNKGCNQCWKYSACSKNPNVIMYKTKSTTEFEYGTTSKGLVQSLKNKIMNIQNESFKLRNNRKPISTKKQKDYYCLMLRKISTLDRKLQNLEDLLLTHLENEKEQTQLSNNDSKTINYKYLNFQDSIRSLLNLANKLKGEMIFRKSNMQCNDDHSSKIYNKILALESELQNFSSYLENLQRNGARQGDLRKSSSQEEQLGHLQNNSELSDDFTSDNELKPHDLPKKYNKKPAVIKSKKKSPNYLNKFERGGFKEVPVCVNLLQTRKSFNSSPFNCQCRICSNPSEEHFNHQNIYAFKGNNLDKKHKYERVKDESVCSCYACENTRKKKRRIRNRKLKNDEYIITDNLSQCSCFSCHNNARNSKNDHKHPKETQFWCQCLGNNKDCYHRTQRTRIRRGTRAKPFYNAVEMSCLQPKPGNFVKRNKSGNSNVLQFRFENNPLVCTHSNLVSPIDSFEEITNAKHFKPVMQTKPAKTNHKFQRIEHNPQNHHRYSRTAEDNKTLTHNKVYCEVSPEKEKNNTKEMNHKKKHSFNRGKTKHFTSKSYKKSNVDYLVEQEVLNEKKNSEVNNGKATHNQSEKIKQFSNKNYNSPHLKKNKLSEYDSRSNSSESGGEMSTANEDSYDDLQCHNYYRKSKLNSSYKIPNKYSDQNVGKMIIKGNGEKVIDNYYNTSELFEDDNMQNKSWKYYQRKNNYVNKKDPNGDSSESLRRKHNFNKNNRSKIVGKSKNSSESSETMLHHLKNVNCCKKYDCNFRKYKNHVDLDLAAGPKTKDSSSSNDSSTLRQFVEKLNEIENNVCDNCIIKEKKIKVSPHYLQKNNCKNGVKIIIKKEVIRCPDCTSKLDGKVFNVTEEKPTNKLNLKYCKKLCKYREEEDNASHEKMENNNTEIGFEFNKNRNQNNSRGTTKNNKTQHLRHFEAVPIFQTKLDQQNIFETSTDIQTSKLPGLQKSLTNISASYKKSFNAVRKSGDKSIEPINEDRSPFKKISPTSANINNRESSSVLGIKSPLRLMSLKDNDTKYIVEENTKKGNFPSSLISPKMTETITKPNNSNNSNRTPVKSKESQNNTVNSSFDEQKLHNRLNNDESNIINEIPFENSKENLNDYLNESGGQVNREKLVNVISSNKKQNQKESDLFSLATTKNKHKNELEKDNKPNFMIKDHLEENNTSHNTLSNLKEKEKSNVKNFNSSLDKHTVNNNEPMQTKNIALRNKKIAVPHNNTLKCEGYSYSNNTPPKGLLNKINQRPKNFLKRYRSFDESSRCNCLLGSSTSKVSSFTDPSCCNLCVSKRIGLKKSTRPTFIVKRRSSKPLKYWQVSHSKIPSRTINHIKKPAIDYKKLTQAQFACYQLPTADGVSKSELKDSNNDKSVITVTSESSFSVVNWAEIAQKLKKEKC